MAGFVGTVKNTSGQAFATYKVREWLPWMERVVIEHLAGVSVPELSEKFDKTTTMIRNILSTTQAREIVERFHKSALGKVDKDIVARLTLVKEKAIANIATVLEREDLLQEHPFAMAETSRKALDTVARLDKEGRIPTQNSPSPTNNTVQQTFIQNIIQNTSPDILNRLRNSTALLSDDVSEGMGNVEYVGAPPPRESTTIDNTNDESRSTTQNILGSGDPRVPSESKNGFALLSARSADTTVLPFTSIKK